MCLEEFFQLAWGLVFCHELQVFDGCLHVVLLLQPEKRALGAFINNVLRKLFGKTTLLSNLTGLALLKPWRVSVQDGERSYRYNQLYASVIHLMLTRSLSLNGK